MPVDDPKSIADQLDDLAMDVGILAAEIGPANMAEALRRMADELEATQPVNEDWFKSLLKPKA